jgi:hypothetical protein
MQDNLKPQGDPISPGMQHMALEMADAEELAHRAKELQDEMHVVRLLLKSLGLVVTLYCTVATTHWLVMMAWIELPKLVGRLIS